jgi:hypothetical protein
MVDGPLNAEYEQIPFNRAGASDAHIYLYIYTHT